MPDHIKRTIEDLYYRHVPISPNKNDEVKRRHPLYPVQVESKQAMLRFETSNELWLKFILEHVEMAINMRNVKMPNTAPMRFRSNAPWKMHKAMDTGCLCKDCVNFHLLRRGTTGACAAIDKIVGRMNLPSNNTVEMRVKLDQLIKIKEIIPTPNKYDTIVKCLHPCLVSDKLDDAKYTCLLGDECESCGFR